MKKQTFNELSFPPHRLDIAQHMSLCRHYVRELRRSVLVSTPDLNKEGAGSRRSSAMLETPDGLGGPSQRVPPPLSENRDNDQRLSAFLRADAGVDPNQRDEPEPGANSAFLSTPDPLTDSTSPAHTVSRSDIRASAEKILYTYLLRGCEREIVLPAPILEQILHAIEYDGRDDPEVFDEAKDYVFQAMERDAFPGFLRSKALGNLIPAGSMARLIIGLLGMFAGFWAGFVMIFLDTKPKVERAWVCF